MIPKTYRHKSPSPSIEDLIKERNELFVKRTNPKRLEKLTKILDYLFYGIK